MNHVLYTTLATLCLAAATFAQSTAAVSAGTVSFVDFENRTPGVYGNAEAKEDFKRNDYDKSWWYALDKNNGENSKIVYDGEQHGNVLQLKYPKGCVGPNDNDTPACAGQIIQPLVKVADTMWSAYDIFFEDGFEFNLGGKLPGLCGGKCYTGNAMPQTGDGWSARIMWRKGGNAVQLIYFMGQASEYGDKNGRVQAWLDGELALDIDTLRLRDYDTVHVDKFYLSTFHGGSSAEWAPTHDCFIRFDNFAVSTDSIAVTANAPDTSSTDRIWTPRQNRAGSAPTEMTPTKAYRINGSRVGEKKANYEVKVGR